MAEINELDGFYAIYYHGVAGQGLAQIQLTDGRIVGADAAGGIWDGKYAVNPTSGIVACEVTIRLPLGATLATTGRAPVPGEADGMRFNLPLDFATKPYVSIDLPIGKVNVRFQKIR